MRYEFIQYCKENKKKVIGVFLITLLLLGLQLLSSLSTGNRYISDKSGQIVAIARNSVDEEVSIPLRVSASKGRELTEEEIIVSFFAEKPTSINGQGVKNPGSELTLEIKRIVDKLTQTKKKIVPLPSKTSDGVKLKWKESRNRENTLLLFLLAPGALLFLYRLEKDKLKKEKEERVQSIKRYLPSLNSQLLLLLGSGLIFNDAFLRIADSYRRRKEKVDYLGQIIVGVVQKAEDTNSSIVLTLDEEAKALGIKEFSRVVGVIIDNQFKGVSLIDKLDNESQLLWNQCKKTAEEKGKLAETKLAFPLAVLLVVLIIVTAAPAILQI